uniref:E3 ubiquitin-protein ligase n=1 Tax=Heterorhabditis bacteriophora TaxID=37862 RepID=A0A1I7WZZ3_HETBA
MSRVFEIEKNKGRSEPATVKIFIKWVIKFVDIKENIVKQFTNIFENKFGEFFILIFKIVCIKVGIDKCIEFVLFYYNYNLKIKNLFLQQYMMCSTDRKYCPVCRAYFALPIGSQPEGSTMKIRTIRGLSLEGHPDSVNTIEITYWIPDGIQGPNHLRPGIPYYGTRRVAFLPDSPSGQMV